jgi:sulfate/thiosulfate-binding protein
MKRTSLLALAVLATGIAGGPALSGAARADTQLLNVSYDPTREYYAEITKVFAEQWKAKTGETVTVRSSHGGSGAQARSVIDGLEADIVTLGLTSDIDQISKTTGLIPANWATRLPDNSVPYTSVAVFLVRKGNPKGIHDWADLVKPGVSVITPNPKTSAGARWNFLAAWAYGRQANGGDDAKAQAYVTELYKHVPVLDTGSRGATITFVQRHQGDVLIAGENEAQLAVKQLSQDGLEIVVPKVSILIEAPVSVVDGNVDKHGTRKVAEAYLKFLFTPEGQEIAAKHFFRPQDPAVLAKYVAQYPKVATLSTIKEFGGWPAAQPKYFGDGGVFDQIYKPQ